MAAKDVVENVAFDWIVVREPIEIAIGGTPLMCTKHDALWRSFEGGTRTTRRFGLSRNQRPGAEFLFIKGRIAHSVSEEFVFESRALSVTANRSLVGFEYQELEMRA